MPPVTPEGSRGAAPAPARASGGGFAFGAYRLESHPRRLLRDGTPVDLSPRQLHLLHELVATPHKVLSKDTLMTAVWGETFVSENSVERMVSDLRIALDEHDRHAYIRNVPRQGYQFVAPVTPVAPAADDVDVYALLAPDRAWGEGLAALETLERDQLLGARATLDRLVSRHPREARFRIGLALTSVLLFDSTRVDSHPDAAMLQRAASEAHEACRLSPDLAEAWATLGFVLERTGDREDAIAALRRATRLDAHNWRHHCRLAMATWGQERLGAVRDTLARHPGFAIARFLGATVWVAREALDDAEREIDEGLAAMAAVVHAPPRYRAVALHYLKGLLRLARGAEGEAIAAFDREIALESQGHLYGRECCANAWYAKGACLLRRGDVPAARAAFTEALARVPQHPTARVGLALVGRRDGPHAAGRDAGMDAGISQSAEDHEPSTLLFEREMARAAWLVDQGDAPGAAALIGFALAAAPPGNTGWLVPIEPLLRVSDHPDVWAPVLALLHARAR
jgi:DNA-binding winged helix-turn-helix (wHTH) protein/Flp pilus assembly protein TadD